MQRGALIDIKKTSKRYPLRWHTNILFVSFSVSHYLDSWRHAAFFCGRPERNLSTCRLSRQRGSTSCLLCTVTRAKFASIWYWSSVRVQPVSENCQKPAKQVGFGWNSNINYDTWMVFFKSAVGTCHLYYVKVEASCCSRGGPRHNVSRTTL